MASNKDGSWETITPKVDSSAEFREITNDFGNPLELVREAVSNAIDWEASQIHISFTVEDVHGDKRLVIRLKDDGTGMSKETLRKDFWGLGFSQSRDLKQHGEGKHRVGDKGHGTKIYLRSQSVRVRTQGADGAFESICENPSRDLNSGQLHTPRLVGIDSFLGKNETGTEIEIIGYNDNERASFIQSIVKDYLMWFTKAGSVEREFGIDNNKDFTVFLKCLDHNDEPEQIMFGHHFPKESQDINKLLDKHDFDAADYYVKRFCYPCARLTNSPEVTFDVVIYIEGDKAKREYNPLIRQRVARTQPGTYKVADRYGIWLCKDYIPITRVNEWITGFGTGSNSLTLVHGFVNCQHLQLTANRGTISNSDPKILSELEEKVQAIFDEIDTHLQERGIYTLRSWQNETKTLKQEASEFKNRVKSIKARASATVEDRVLLEPRNESELSSLLMTIYATCSDKFSFEPLDYNTSRGIDLIARNKTRDAVSDSEFWYVELKFILKPEFNHAFRNLRWIVCWDFDKSIDAESQFQGIEESDVRYLVKDQDDDGHPIYFLDNRRKAKKIEVIRFREFLKNKLHITFD